MNVNEKAYASMRFKIMVYRLEGKSFEDFFVQIMVADNRHFIPVKPYGNMGDRSNDGFNRVTGSYYQVYAPENISTNINTAINKMHHDFQGLYNYWQSFTPIKQFFFVINDKYKGIGPQLHPELKKIEATYRGVVCNEFFAQHLEDIAFSLPDDRLYDIIGFLPSIETISIFDPGVMNEVVTSLLQNYSSFVPTPLPKNPNFEPKITFNKLGEYAATLLRHASYQGGSLNEYFRTSVVLKDKLKQIFSALYKRIDTEVPQHIANRSDIIFDAILQEAHPQASKRAEVNTVVLVLMAYYFDLCDIFEEPPQYIQQSLFNI